MAWNDICGVAAIVETASAQLRVEPSQGSHFFHNITTLGIKYIMVSGKDGERFDWDWLNAQEVVSRGEYVVHVRLPVPMVIKVDGRTSRCAITPGGCGEGLESAASVPAPPEPGCCTPDSGGTGVPGRCAL